MRRLREKNIDASIIGEVTNVREGVKIVYSNGVEEQLRYPKIDPFWPAFFKTVEKIKESKK